MAIAAIGFDLDYTLAVPERERAVLLTEASRAVGEDPITREAYLDAHRDHLTAETRAPIFDRLLDEEASADRAQALASAYRTSINESLDLIEGADDLLTTLQERFRVGLLTNGPTRAQREKLAALGWEEAFDATVVSGELTAGKPDQAAFDALLEALGTTPGETVYVGDQVEADVAGAAAAGLYVVQVLFPDGPAPDPRADAHIDRTGLATELEGVINSF